MEKKYNAIQLTKNKMDSNPPCHVTDSEVDCDMGLS